MQNIVLSPTTTTKKDPIDCLQYTIGESRDGSKVTTSRMYYELSAQPTYKKNETKLLDKGLS